MTQEEINKRNEAIDLMLELKTEDCYNECQYNDCWGLLMPAYEHIHKLGHVLRIESSQYPEQSNNFWINSIDIRVGNNCEDLKTAIWLTVSDFAIEFNKKKE